MESVIISTMCLQVYKTNSKPCEHTQSHTFYGKLLIAFWRSIIH